MWGLRTENEFSIFQPENARFHALGFQRFLPGGRRGKDWGSRNLVGIAIQLSDSEEEEFFVGYPMLISPEKFDFGIE